MKKKTFREKFAQYEGMMTTILGKVKKGEKLSFRAASSAQADTMRMRIYTARRVIEQCEGEENGPVEWIVDAAKDIMVLKRLDKQGWRVDVVNRRGKDNPYNTLWLESYIGDPKDLDPGQVFDIALEEEEKKQERERIALASRKQGEDKIQTLRNEELPPGLGFGKINIEQYEKERELERKNIDETVDKGESN